MLIWTGLRRSVSAIQRLFNSAAFYAPLTHSLVPERGTGSPTFTRASTATFRDWEGVLKTVPSGCARFEGARMVRNLCSANTNDVSTWNTSGVIVGTTPNVVAAPDGTMTAGLLDFGANTSCGKYLVTAVTMPVGATASISVYLRAATAGTIMLEDSSGVAASITANLTTSWQRFNLAATTVAGARNGAPFVRRTNSGQLQQVYVWGGQVEDVTGQADQTASEYVSVGVGSAPYHGAGVDGVEFFNTDRDGAVIPAATNTGYLAEGARTQILATADIRDMTTAAWTLGATMTRARTSVGADGAANSANRLTGGAVAATNTCYTTIVAAASSRTYSALVKRVTGTGPVRIVQTGTETDISSQLATTGYALVQLTASVLNVAVGFKIDTNGDAIDVDFNQFEAGAFASSRIAAVGTRAADVLTYPSAGNISGTVGWAYAEASSAFSTTSGVSTIVGFGSSAGVGNAGLAVWATAATAISVSDGTNRTEKTGLASLQNATQKLASSWGGSTQAITGGGAAVASGTFDGNNSPTAIEVGALGGSNFWFGTIRNVRIGQRKLSASEMQAITA